MSQPSLQTVPQTFSIAHLAVGEVMAKSNQWYLVRYGTQTLAAQCATSFLFVPEIHDQVLLVLQGEETFITQILQRKADLPLEMRATDPLVLNAKHVQAYIDNLHLQGEAVHLKYQHLQSRSEQVDLQWQHTHYQGKNCGVELEKAQLTAEYCHTFFDTLTVKAKHVLQWIEQLKQQMLGRLHISVDKHYQLDCQSADIYSQEDVKIDAKQIHLG